MSAAKVLKASGEEELIKERHVKFAHLPTAVRATKQSRNEREKESERGTKRPGEREGDKVRGTLRNGSLNGPASDARTNGIITPLADRPLRE